MIWALRLRVNLLRTMATQTQSQVSLSESYPHAERVFSAAIAAVSPMKLVSDALSFDKTTNTLTAGSIKYKLNRNVKVVAFGKAVLGMVAAVEEVIGEHVIGGVASVPVGTLESAQTHFPQYLPSDKSNVRICEGALHNLPDKSAELTAREILRLVEDAGREELILTLISGGGSALLPCPVDGVSLEEKRQVVEVLARRGADINELNMFRKAVSRTKGGKLAEAAYPSSLLALILSDVIGDPLETIASGPTVPSHISTQDVLAMLDKYLQRAELPSSITAHLNKTSTNSTDKHPSIGSDGQYAHVQNMLVGTNRVATEGALVAAEGLGYSSHIWSHSVQGEARELGELFAILAHRFLLLMEGKPQELLELQILREYSLSQELKDDLLRLQSSFYLLERNSQICLISGGEPTVTVTGGGRGGRNQEMALAFAIKLNELSRSHRVSSHCVFVSVGTDGQDGPCNAAGAIVDRNTVIGSNLDPVAFLENNDSYTYFSQLKGGKHLIRTGLTGTNVMDIHLLFLSS